MKRHLILLLILKNNSMNRRDFSKITALGMTVAPFISAAHANDPLFDTPGENPKVPLGMDAHAISLMKWKSKQLIDYAIDLNMDSILFNALSYFDNLEEDYLKTLHDLLETNKMKFYFGVGSLSVNSRSYVPKSGTPKELILSGIRVAKIFNASSVNCKIGNIADRYTDGGIVARMEEIIHELRSMRSQIQDAGIKFAVENHAGDMRSEEVLHIVETVGTDICGVMLDPGNSVWAMENPMQQIEKLGKHVLCTSVRDYKIWESENGATFQWTSLGAGTMDFQHYTKRMSELCPGVPLHIETVSNRQN
jgi:sugar phosphate isomerase/epimerase